jgi:hypothetical protein
MDANTKVSKFFSYGELWRSEGAKRLGINNEPTLEHLENLIWYANNIGDPCRMFVGGPLHISFYRSEALNNATPGSAKPSFHMLGCAGDIDCNHYGYGKNSELFQWIANNLTFAQMIYEFGDEKEPNWIHVTAFPESKKSMGGLIWNQKKLTRAIKVNGITKYINFDL